MSEDYENLIDELGRKMVVESQQKLRSRKIKYQSRSILRDVILLHNHMLK